MKIDFRKTSLFIRWLNTWRLKMCPEKCFYTIFSQNLKSGEKGTKGITRKRFDLSMYVVKIDIKIDPMFLGMQFDKYRVSRIK